MKCPQCGNLDNRVLDTRTFRDSEIRRRRECVQCKARFTTVESILVAFPHVIKKDGRREPYSKEKLRKGVQIACKKRPVSISDIENLIANVSRWVQSMGEREVDSKAIGRTVVSELKKLDDVAYVRFASVYKTFTDVNEFVESLHELGTEKNL